MPTTKTIKKQLTKEDVTRIVRELFNTEIKDKIDQASEKEYKGDIKSINSRIDKLTEKIDSNFKWLLSIIIIGFISIFFGFQQQINSIKDDNTQIKLEVSALKINQKLIIDTLNKINKKIK